MKKQILSIFLCLLPLTVQAATLPWSNNFSTCPDYNDSNNGQAWPLGSCGLSENGNDNQICTTSNQYSYLNSSAGNPADPGSKGFADAIGDGFDNSSTRPYISLSVAYPEIWVRWYMKYDLGFTWSGGEPSFQKLIYLISNGYDLIDWYQGNTISFTANGIDSRSDNPIAFGWQNAMGGATGDGKWHCYEAHFKMDTNGSNGIGDFWFDGVYKGGTQTANWGTSAGFTGIIEFATNQNAPANGKCAYNYWTDIAIYGNNQPPTNHDAQGRVYIGPLSSGPTPTIVITTVVSSGTGTAYCPSPDDYGASVTCTITPGTGQITSSAIGCGGMLSGNLYQIQSGYLTSNCTATFTFVPLQTTYTVTPSATAHAYISPSTAQTVTSGLTTAFTVSVDPNYTLSVGGTCGGLLSGATYTINPAVQNCSVISTATATIQSSFFTENFNDANFAARGWYDGPFSSATITTNSHSGAGAFQCRFLQRATTCSDTGGGGPTMRMTFTPSNSIYVSYWTLLSPNWVGSGTTYHPHINYLLTNQDCTTAQCYPGLAITHLTAYMEVNGNNVRFDAQDGSNVNTSFLNVNLCPGQSGSTEARANFGCNGLCNSDHWDSAPDCYVLSGINYTNDVTISPVPITLNNWHHIEGYFQLNTIVGGIGQNNGIMQMWVDGVQSLNYTDIIYRTGAYPTMLFNQFVLAPYNSPPGGSPVDQYFLMDDLVVAATPPVGAGSPPSPPSKFNVFKVIGQGNRQLNLGSGARTLTMQ